MKRDRTLRPQFYMGHPQCHRFHSNNHSNNHVLRSRTLETKLFYYTTKNLCESSLGSFATESSSKTQPHPQVNHMPAESLEERRLSIGQRPQPNRTSHAVCQGRIGSAMVALTDPNIQDSPTVREAASANRPEQNAS